MGKKFILKKIVLYNIFNYRKKNTIDFQTDKKGNIFLFDVENGGGKTSLFLAIKWGFYGNDSSVEYIKDGEKLTNKDFINIYEIDSDNRFYVEIYFDYDDNDYVLMRECKNPRINESELVLKKNGHVYSGVDAKRMTNDMIPPDYGEFFMFNGETLQDIANNQRSTKKIDGVLKLLGLKQLSDLETTLNEVKRNITNKIAKCGEKSGNNNIKQKKVADLKIQIDEQNDIVDRNTQLKEKYERSLKTIDEELEKYSNTEDMVKQYNDLRDKRDELKDKNAKIKGNIGGKSEDAFSLFIKNDLEYLIGKNKEKINDYLQISSMTEDEALVDKIQMDIIEKHMDSCPICGALFDDEKKSTIAKSIYASREKLKRFNENKEKLSKLRYENAILKNCIDKMLIKLQDDLDNLSLNSFDLRKFDKALETINGQLAVSAIDEIKKLGEDKINVSKNLSDCENNISKANSSILLLTHERDTLISKIVNEGGINDEYARLCKENEYIVGMMSKLKDVIEQVSRAERDNILKKANEVFLRLTNKPETYDHLEYTDDKSFSMDVVLKNGTVQVKPSSGEKHILAISFLISLSLNTDRQSPMMMDTPLSRLDPTHSINIGSTLATLENQVIFLAQPSELSNDVKSRLMPAVAKEFTAELTPDNTANIYEVKE